MLDIGMLEIFVIGALALIVVGPKDLPGLLRTVGQFVAKARGMAREFQRTMEDAARDADLGDVADAVKSGGNLNKLPFDNQVVDSLKEFQKSVKSEMNQTADAVNAVDKPAASKPEASKPDAPKSDTPKPETPKADAPKADKPAAKPAAPAPKPAAAKPKPAAEPKPAPEKSA